VDPAPQTEHLGYRMIALEVDDMQKTADYLRTKRSRSSQSRLIRTDRQRAVRIVQDRPRACVSGLVFAGPSY